MCWKFLIALCISVFYFELLTLYGVFLGQEFQKSQSTYGICGYFYSSGRGAWIISSEVMLSLSASHQEFHSRITELGGNCCVEACDTGQKPSRVTVHVSAEKRVQYSKM